MKLNTAAYFLCQFSITAWPFLNFYASHDNHKGIDLWEYSSLFLFVLGFGLSLSFCLIKFLKCSKERAFCFYAWGISWFFYYRRFCIFCIDHHIVNEVFNLYIALGVIGFYVTYYLSPYFYKIVQGIVVALFCASLIENIIISYDSSYTYRGGSKYNAVDYCFKTKPNIYFFLLDAYPREDTLRDVCGQDNAELLNWLKNKDFLVAEKAYANYFSTEPSLTATFHMSYIHPNDIDHSNVLNINMPVFQVLKKNNYRFILLPCAVRALQGQRQPDRTLFPFINKFIYCFPILRKSVLSHFFKGPLPDPSLNDIQEALNEGGPKFVFAHFLHVHEWIKLKKFPKPHTKHPIKKIYLSEWGDSPKYALYSCVKNFNIFLEKALQRILSQDPTAIIIVQSDHGPYWKRNWKKPSHVKDAFAIFSAIRAPHINEKSQKYLIHSPTPVNLFRIIFSHLSDRPSLLLKDYSLFGKHLIEKIYSPPRCTFNFIELLMTSESLNFFKKSIFENNNIKIYDF